MIMSDILKIKPSDILHWNGYKRSRMVCMLFYFLLSIFSNGIAEPSWLKVLPGKTLVYPKDHGSHPEYPIEWWYITGHLTKADTLAAAEDILGFQITFFRVGISSGVDGPSKWHTKALIISHSAITDEKQGTYCSEERSDRAVAGSAGADQEQLHTWVGEQVLETKADGFKATFSCKGRKLTLELQPSKPLVLHGDRGYVQKGISEGDASYYVSYSRMKVIGTIGSGDDLSKVTGEGWFDHEIVSSPVEKDDVGWDWFALQLSDNSEIMIYRLRDRSGQRAQFSRGAYIDTLGKVTELKSDECELVGSKVWRSKGTGASYPLLWSVKCHSNQTNFSLTIKATLPDQEFSGGSATGKRYWEGRVKVSGNSKGQAISGSGYLEMVNTVE